MDTFTLIVTVGMVLLILWVVALGIWHPRTGADVLQWKPTRSAEVESRNEADDLDQMIAAQNALRVRRGKAARTQAEVEAEVRSDQRMLMEYADAYWADQRRERAAADAGVGLVVYEATACSNCRRLHRLLAERGIAFERIDVHEPPLSVDRIRGLLAKARVSPRAALRTREPGAQALLDADASDEAILAAMAAEPVLLQRPIVERGARAVLARPVERVLELL